MTFFGVIFLFVHLNHVSYWLFWLHRFKRSARLCFLNYFCAMFCSNKTFEEFESELVYLKEEKGTKKINYFAKKDSQMLGFAKHLTLKKDDSSYLTTFHGIVVTIPNSVSPFPIICE